MLERNVSDLYGYIPIHVYMHYSSPRKNAYWGSMSSLGIERLLYRLLEARGINLVVDNGAGEGGGAEDEDEEIVVAGEADKGERTMTLHASERSRKSTNLTTGREATTRRWGRQAPVHQRKVYGDYFCVMEIQNGDSAIRRGTFS